MGTHLIASFFFFTLYLQVSWQTPPDKDYYVGAVVNYRPVRNKEGTLSTLMDNVAAYTVYIAQASAENADIIVFPRNGLRGLRSIRVPLLLDDPKKKTVPCRSHSNKVLKYLSCASQSNAIYTVVSLDELVELDSNKTKICSSIIAFDRDGALIARRRERKCGGDEGDGSFETDFGVRMGLMDDRDLFDAQLVSSMKKGNVTHTAVPFDAVNRLPFNTGIQVQSFWAYQADLGLLAAGLDARRRTGSGIYRGRDGPLVYTSASDYKSGLVIQAISKADGGKAPHITEYWDVFSKDRVKRKSSASVYTSTEVDVKVSKRDVGEEDVLADSMEGYHKSPLEDNSQAKVDTDGTFIRRIQKKQTMCANTLCCSFDATLTSRYVNEQEGKLPLLARSDDFSMNQYYFVVYDGFEQFRDGIQKHVKRCAIMSGLSKKPLVLKDPKHGNIYQIDSTLENVAITANATLMGPNILITGTGMDFGGLLTPQEYNLTTTTEETRLFSSKPVNKVITYGLQSYLVSKHMSTSSETT